MLQKEQRFHFVKPQKAAVIGVDGCWHLPAEAYGSGFQRTLDVSPEDIFEVTEAYSALVGWAVTIKRERDGAYIQFLQNRREKAYVGELDFDPDHPKFIKDDDIIIQ